jgi:hypothetical protein
LFVLPFISDILLSYVYLLLFFLVSLGLSDLL